MKKVLHKNIEELRKAVEKEFPEDPALQQVHIARKILADEAREKGLSYLAYIKSLRRKEKHGV